MCLWSWCLFCLTEVLKSNQGHVPLATNRWCRIGNILEEQKEDGEMTGKRRMWRRNRGNPRPTSCCWHTSWSPSSSRRGKVVPPHPSSGSGSYLCPFYYHDLFSWLEQIGLCLHFFMLRISKLGFSHAAEQHQVSTVRKIHSAGRFNSWHLWSSWQQNATCEGFITSLHWQLTSHSSWFSCHSCLTGKSWGNYTLSQI